MYKIFHTSSSVCLGSECRGSICFEGVSETRHGKYDACAARGMAEALGETLHWQLSICMNLLSTESRGRGRDGEGGRERGRGAETLLERNATHFPEEKRQLLFAICARWLYF